jgi:hypothetical protein
MGKGGDNSSLHDPLHQALHQALLATCGCMQTPAVVMSNPAAAVHAHAAHFFFHRWELEASQCLYKLYLVVLGLPPLR